MDMKFELVFIPCFGINHLRLSVEMAKLLLDQEKRLSVTVIILPFLFPNRLGDVYVEVLLKSSTDRLHYELISGESQDPTTKPTPRMEDHIEEQKPKVKLVVEKLLDTYATVPDSPRIVGFVVDMFCVTMIDVAEEFRLPSYYFSPLNAGFLGLEIQVQRLNDEGKFDVSETEYENSEAELIIPSFSRPFPVKCLPYGLVSKQWLPMIGRFREMKGILVNTVPDLEPYALESLSRDDDIPTVYSVGPMLHLKPYTDDRLSDILEWLDEQPTKSVVFLCLGIIGGFTEEQAIQIAAALERSGHPFLWAVRLTSPDRKSYKEFEDLEKILSKGFFDRTKKRGKVVCWAPPMKVLAKPAIGGFVTQCGWHTMLDSLWFDIPTAAWPFYEEYKFIAFEMVEELGLAVEIGDLLAPTGTKLIMAKEIEQGIDCLMEEDSDVRKRVKDMSEKCHSALTEGGSAQIGLQTFIQDVFKNFMELYALE